MATTATADTPATKSPAYQRMEPDWELCRDFFAGARAIRAKGVKYLPKFEKEKQKNYERRLNARTPYNGFKRTILALAGMVMQRPPVLGDDVPAAIKDYWEHIDGLDHGKVFVRRLLRDGLITGLAGILVDYPAVEDPERVTLEQEQRLGLRPYWVFVRAEDVLSVRTMRVGSREIFTQLVIRECTEVDDGNFGTRERVQYRVFRNRGGAGQVTFELWEDKEGETTGKRTDVVTTLIKQESVVRGKGGKPIPEIPFAPFFAGEKEGAFECAPPLLDLANSNLDHWKVHTDRGNAISLACTPTPVRIGVGQDAPPMVLGPSSSIDIPDPNGDAKWMELTGTAFGPTKDEMQMIEQFMAAVGIAFLYGETRSAETATAKEMDANAQNATLTLTVDNLQDCLERALELTGMWIETEGGSIAINREFLKILMAPEMVAQLKELRAAGDLSLNTLLETLKRGNVFWEDFEVEEEEARILAEGRAPEMTDPKDQPGDVKPPVVDPALEDAA